MEVIKHLRRVKKEFVFGESILKKPTFYSKRNFTEREYRILSLNRNNVEDYLPESLRYQTIKINGVYKDIFNNKLMFYDFFKNDIPIAKNIYYVDGNGRIIDLENNGKVIKVEEMIRNLEKVRTIVKPVVGGGGHGVFNLEYLGEGSWKYDESEIDIRSLKDKIKNMKHHLFTEFVEQSKYTKVLNPKSTNTFRVMMIRNPKTGRVKTIRVLLRIGNKKTGIADNFDDGDGGFIGKIDFNNETLESVVMISDDYYPQFIYRHPDHGASFENRKFPGLKNAIKDLEDVFESYPLFNYVGWDLVLTEKGYTVIEANNHPGFMFAQIYEPLMKSEEEREFYTYWMEL